MKLFFANYAFKGQLIILCLVKLGPHFFVSPKIVDRDGNLVLK